MFACCGVYSSRDWQFKKISREAECIKEIKDKLTFKRKDI